MRNREMAFAVVGVLIGGVLGFFGNEVRHQQPGTSPVASNSEMQSELPEGHPPADVMQLVQQLEAHAKEHPEHADVKIRLGNVYYDMGRYDAAVSWYEQAIEQEPDNVAVNNDLATSYFAIGNVDRAIELLNKSLTMEENNPVALQNLGWVFFSTEKHEEAIKYWSLLVEVHPGYENIEAVKKQLENAKAHLEGAHS